MSPRPLLLPITALMLATAAVGVAVPAGAGTPTTSERTTTCQGERATIIGDGRPITGTDGPDVVISNGARRVETGDGADLICLTGSPASVTVLSGAGADRVEVLRGAAPGLVTARLGAGPDTYLGSAGVDRVLADDVRVDAAGRGTDRSTDRILTGAGADEVTIGGRVATADVVDLGPDRDVLHLAGTRTATGAELRGGAGADTVRFDAGLGGGEVTVSNRGRSVPAEVRTGGFEVFTSQAAAGSSLAVTFLGGAVGEQVALPRIVSAALAGGDDTVALDARTDATVRGGEGSDLLELLTTDVVDATLADDSVLTFDPTEAALRRGYDVREMERYRFGGAAVEVTGSDGPDLVLAQSCVVDVDGLGGADVLAVTGPIGGATCPSPDIELRGGEGDDVLVGGSTDDTLLGGPGTDTADGREGSDTCEAETETACELDPAVG